MIISLLAGITLLTNILFIIMVLYFLIKKNIQKPEKNISKIEKYFYKYLLTLILIVSSIATLGSLYFSEIAGFEPCKLCWLQRIFMYPLTIIIGVAMYKKVNDVLNYILPLTLVGLAVAIYHYYFQITGSSLVPCSTVGFSVSCSERFFTYFGYITIPWMSLSAFLYIFVLSLLGRKFS